MNFSHYTHPESLEMIKFDSKICQITWERMSGHTILEPVSLSKHGLKFIYSEKATKVCEISNLLLTGTT